jgi:hypothetical protein
MLKQKNVTTTSQQLMHKISIAQKVLQRWWQPHGMIEFTKKEDHEEKWQLERHLPKVNNGKCWSWQQFVDHYSKGGVSLSRHFVTTCMEIIES